jgi:hypothetical protein
MQSQILRPNFGSLTALFIALVTVAALALALLVSHPAAIVTSPAAAPAAPTVVALAPAEDPNPDSNLPICKRKGGPIC